MGDNNITDFPEKSTIRSIEEIIKQHEEKKQQELKLRGSQYTFNIESGATVTIILSSEGVKHG